MENILTYIYDVKKIKRKDKNKGRGIFDDIFAR